MNRSAGWVVFGDPDDQCPCGSGRVGEQCCLDGSGYIRGVPAGVTVPELSGAFSHPRCYAGASGGCSAKLTREHFISKSLLERLEANGGQIHVTKFPWLADGESKHVGAANLNAKVLCERHNKAFRPYDEIGTRFLTTVLEVGHPKREAGSRITALFNGADVERWLLKVLCGVAAMEAKPTAWGAPRKWVDALLKRDGDRLPPGMGLWFNLELVEMFSGDTPSFSATPIDSNDGGPPLGLRFHFCGLELILMAGYEGRSRVIRNGRFKPGILELRSPHYRDVTIGMSYSDSPMGVHLSGEAVAPPSSA